MNEFHNETHKEMEERKATSKLWAANIRGKYSDEQLASFSIDELLDELVKGKNFYVQKELAKRAGMLEFWENSETDLLYRPLFKVLHELGVEAEYSRKERESRKNK